MSVELCNRPDVKSWVQDLQTVLVKLQGLSGMAEIVRWHVKSDALNELTFVLSRYPSVEPSPDRVSRSVQFLLDKIERHKGTLERYSGEVAVLLKGLHDGLAALITDLDKHHGTVKTITPMELGVDTFNAQKMNEVGVYGSLTPLWDTVNKRLNKEVSDANCGTEV